MSRGGLIRATGFDMCCIAHVLHCLFLNGPPSTPIGGGLPIAGAYAAVSIMLLRQSPDHPPWQASQSDTQNCSLSLLAAHRLRPFRGGTLGTRIERRDRGRGTGDRDEEREDLVLDFEVVGMDDFCRGVVAGGEVGGVPAVRHQGFRVRGSGFRGRQDRG